MPNYTEHHKLIKPENFDFYDIGVHNQNMDTIDTQLTQLRQELQTKATADGTLQTNLNAEMLNGFKMYHSIQSLGIPFNASFEEIADAMPAPSILCQAMAPGALDIQKYPVSSGILIVTKPQHSRVAFELVHPDDGIRYWGKYSDEAAAFSGWVKAPTEADLEDKVHIARNVYPTAAVTDFNNLPNGYCRVWDQDGTMPNSPEERFDGEVFTNDDRFGFTTQVATSANSRRYYRESYSNQGAWSSWHRLATEEDLKTKANVDTEQTWHTPTFSNTYTVSAADPNKLQFSKDSLGNVWVSGAFIKPSQLVSGESVFTLPVGYRPSKAVYSIAISGNLFMGNLILETDGVAYWSQAGAPSEYTPNNGISIHVTFKAIG